MSMVHTDAVFFEDDKAFETWLVDHASTATHVWVRMAKKGTGVTSIDWTRAVDVALCFGWIDGISRRIDDAWYVQRFTPRRAKSVWSKINRERIERLTAGHRRLGPVVPAQPLQHHGRVLLLLVAVVREQLFELLVVSGVDALVVPIDGLELFHD